MKGPRTESWKTLSSLSEIQEGKKNQDDALLRKLKQKENFKKTQGQVTVPILEKSRRTRTEKEATGSVAQELWCFRADFSRLVGTEVNKAKVGKKKKKNKLKRGRRPESLSSMIKDNYNVSKPANLILK